MESKKASLNDRVFVLIPNAAFYKLLQGYAKAHFMRCFTIEDWVTVLNCYTFSACRWN